MKAVLSTYGMPTKAHRPMSFVLVGEDKDEELENKLNAIALAKETFPILATTDKLVEYNFQPAILTVKIYD